MSIMSSRNLTMMTDLYQLTMMYGYFKKGMAGNKAVFDLFFRDTKANSSYAVMAGTESIVEYINDLHFSENDVAYLRSLNLFDESFLSVLRGLHFTGEIYAMEEALWILYHLHSVFQVLKDSDYCATWCDCLLHDGRKQNGQSYNGYLL